MGPAPLTSASESPHQIITFPWMQTVPERLAHYTGFRMVATRPLIVRREDNMLLDQAAIQLDDDSVLMLRQMYLASLARTSRKTSALPGPGSFLEHPEDNCKQLSAECPGLLILLDYSACQLSSPSISAAWGNSSRRPPRQPLTCQFRVGPTSTHASITCAQSSLDLSSRAITQRAHNVGVQFQFQSR